MLLCQSINLEPVVLILGIHFNFHVISMLFEKNEIEYPACQPGGEIKLRGRSRLWIGSGTEKRLPVFKVKIAVDDVDGDKEPMFSGENLALAACHSSHRWLHTAWNANAIRFNEMDTPSIRIRHQ